MRKTYIANLAIKTKKEYSSTNKSIVLQISNKHLEEQNRRRTFYKIFCIWKSEPKLSQLKHARATWLQDFNKRFERMIANFKLEISLLKEQFAAKDSYLIVVVGCR